jgi:hypothetical protein
MPPGHPEGRLTEINWFDLLEIHKGEVPTVQSEINRATWWGYKSRNWVGYNT